MAFTRRTRRRIDPILIDAAKALKGSQKRLFMAKAVQAVGWGGQRWAQEHLGWCRETIRKGTHELRTGMICVDAFHCRRRKPAEEHLPPLLDNIRSIADGQSEADPKFQTNCLFTRIGAAEVRRQLLATKGYTDEEVPNQLTINTKMNLLGCRLSNSPRRRSAAPKKVPQTDAIFEQLTLGDAGEAGQQRLERVNVATDGRVVDAEEEAEKGVSGVGAVVEQEHQQAVGQVEGMLATGAGPALATRSDLVFSLRRLAKINYPIASGWVRRSGRLQTTVG